MFNYILMNQPIGQYGTTRFEPRGIAPLPQMTPRCRAMLGWPTRVLVKKGPAHVYIYI